MTALFRNGSSGSNYVCKYRTTYKVSIPSLQCHKLNSIKEFFSALMTPKGLKGMSSVLEIPDISRIAEVIYQEGNSLVEAAVEPLLYLL